MEAAFAQGCDPLRERVSRAATQRAVSGWGDQVSQRRAAAAVEAAARRREAEQAAAERAVVEERCAAAARAWRCHQLGRLVASRERWDSVAAAFVQSCNRSVMPMLALLTSLAPTLAPRRRREELRRREEDAAALKASLDVQVAHVRDRQVSLEAGTPAAAPARTPGGAAPALLRLCWHAGCGHVLVPALDAPCGVFR